MSNWSFGLAIGALKAGQRVSRSGWDGKGMWLELVTPEGSTSSGFPLLPWIGMKTADDKFVPWLASQTDVLADDWGVVE